MRLQSQQIETLKRLAQAQFGAHVRVRLFGSRLDPSARGGDVDLLLEVATPIEQPTWQAARLAARMSRALGGRRVDVLLSAPNLARSPIHEIAAKGQLL